ncbi:MAG TPA: L,D-transpeptidase [Pyrinomonadaceae bacterium]|nr:L,D-transpeptidase [Pyrinomonadaceae bacterium]
MNDLKRDSARSDKRTGGKIEKTALVEGEDNLKITINVPAFQLTLWQNGKEVKSYPIGVGMEEYPIFIGMMKASEINWNPVWIPPSSDWIEASSKVKVGEIILPTDPRNPLGKVKIPLGYGYLIHQAKGAGDLGNLVSHGCVRVLQKDLYDLAEKIVAARSLDVSAAQIADAKRTKNMLIAEMETPIPVEITYDTLVVEGGNLNIYPDVYGHKKNTVENLRKELETSNIDDSQLSNATLEKMLKQAVAKKKFVVSVTSLKAGNALKTGKIVAVLGTPTAVKKTVKR